MVADGFFVVVVFFVVAGAFWVLAGAFAAGAGVFLSDAEAEVPDVPVGRACLAATTPAGAGTPIGTAGSSRPGPYNRR